MRSLKHESVRAAYRAVSENPGDASVTYRDWCEPVGLLELRLDLPQSWNGASPNRSAMGRYRQSHTTLPG